MKKGPAIRIENLEVGKAYSIAAGGVAYFIVLEKLADRLIVEYPKNNEKYRIQTKLFSENQDHETNGTRYQYRFQERYTKNPVLAS